MKLFILTATFFTASLAARAAARNDYTTPVPILKQIDKHNEDGSYSYGYEAADGTFKIETKYPDGEVYGKYGYVDDTGALREVEYGASRRGFEPAGNEIQVAPPTLRSSQNAVVRPLAADEEDDGQYREDPALYYQDDPYASKPRDAPTSRYQPQSYYSQQALEPEPEYRPQPARPQSIYAKSSYKPSSYYSRQEPEYEPEYNPEPAYRPQSSYRPQTSYKPQTSYRPQTYYNPPATPAPQPAYRPQSNYGFSNNNWNTNWNNNNNYAPSHQYPQTYNNGFGNVDWQSGSYSVQYKR